MNKTLVILAAGIGSRFGTGIKQLTPIDNNNHLIIDYSIHDSIAAGFDSIIFIIRHDIEADFKAGIGDRIEKICEPLGIAVSYAYQEISNTPSFPGKDGLARTKPWGTGHAVLSCDGLIDGPFAVINAVSVNSNPVYSPSPQSEIIYPTATDSLSHATESVRNMGGISKWRKVCAS